MTTVFMMAAFDPGKGYFFPSQIGCQELVILLCSISCISPHSELFEFILLAFGDSGYLLLPANSTQQSGGFIYCSLAISVNIKHNLMPLLMYPTIRFEVGDHTEIEPSIIYMVVY